MQVCTTLLDGSCLIGVQPIQLSMQQMQFVLAILIILYVEDMYYITLMFLFSF
jgi:hypothetical protein